MAFKFGVAVTLGLASFALVSCSQKDEPAPSAPSGEISASAVDVTDVPALAPALAVLNADYSDAQGQAADLTGLVGALPDFVSLSWDAQSFDEASGANVFDGLELTLTEEVPFGIRFDQARIWGLETGLLEARLGGQRLSETGPLFDRLDGTGLSYIGMAEAANMAIEWMLASMLDDASFDEFEESLEFAVDEFSLEAQRVVITDAYLRPWEYIPVTGDHISAWTGEDITADLPDPDAINHVFGVLHIGQQILATGRSIGYGYAITENSNARFALRLPDETSRVEMSFDLQAVRDIAGMNIGESIAYNMRTLETTDMAGIVSINQEELATLSSVKGLELDKLFGYIARSELPTMDERDLMSFGQWGVEDYTLNLNDKTVATLEAALFDASFDWLVPSEISVEVEALTIDFEEITGFSLILLDAIADDPSLLEGELDGTEELAQFQTGLAKALPLLPEHGLDKITLNGDGQFSWSGETGDTQFKMGSSSAGFGEGAVSLSVTLPNYQQLQAVFEAEDKEAAMSQAFEDSFAFNDFRAFEVDAGGYDKILGFVQAIGKEYPDEGWGAMLGAMEPADMRNYVATMVRIGKGEAEANFPPAATWLESIAGYIEQGGRIEIAVSPPVPISKALIDSYEEEPEPDQIVEIFGISVTHTN